MPCSPHHLVLTAHPQAELATSHKCLSHKVKRLNEENQGLRAEQSPSAAPRGLEQEDGKQEALPSSVPVRRMWALGPPCQSFLSRTVQHWPGATGLVDRSRLPCISCITLANSLHASKAQLPHP